MSRTRISIMENNNKINSTLLGFNANSGNDGACFEFLFNKSLGNGKQYNTAYDLNLISELTGSLIKNVDNIESSNKNEEENTYTLDDLLDLAAVVPDTTSTEAYSFDGAFDLLSGEPQNVCAEVLMDTVIASPLSASSEESCDLDELLFQDENLEAFIPNEGNATLITEVLESSNGSENFLPADQVSVSNASIAGEEIDDGSMDVLTQLGFAEAAVTPNQSQPDLSALCSALFQNQTITTPDDSQSQSLGLLLSLYDEPSSPSSSESSSDEVRYAPYKKARKPKTPEQRLRKKAQNRTAASRYRVKKKDELKTMNAEADDLEEKNKVLRGKVDGLRTEIDYLKNLMLDVIKARLAKGTLSSTLLSVVLENNK